MEKLLYTYLLLAILSVLAYCQNLTYNDSKDKSKTATPIFNLAYSWIISTPKQLISSHLAGNQYLFYKSPIQLLLCPISQISSESIFAA